MRDFRKKFAAVGSNMSFRKKLVVIVGLSFFVLLLAAVAARLEMKGWKNEIKDGRIKMMILTSPIFENGGAIPVKYTCDGGGINPELQIQNVPDEAKSLALIVHDPDAPITGGFTHWVVWNIGPKTTVIKTESVPPGSVEGMTSAGAANYVAPCPHQGTHHYIFYLYALDATFDFPSGTPAEPVKKEIEKHLLAKAELMGTYERR